MMQRAGTILASGQRNAVLYTYQVFGLTLTSDIELPELSTFDTEDASLDVTIERGELPWRSGQGVKGDEFFSVQDGSVEVYIASVGIFKIQEGRKITYSPRNNAPDNVIRLYLLGTCIGVLLMQRGIIPLHGSAVVVNGKAYAFVGESGAGKSTLAATLRLAGYPLISDDIIAVDWTEGSQQPIVLPSYPHQKLWDMSLEGLGLDSAKYQRLIQEHTKYAVPVKEQFAAEPVPLAGIFELAASEQDILSIVPLKGIECLPLLFQHTYRNFFIPRLKLMQLHMDCCSKIAGICSMYQLRRPYSYFSAKTVAEEVLRVIEKGV